MFSERALTSRGDLGDRRDRVVGEVELHVLGLHQRHVLPGQRVLGLGQDADEVVAGRARRSSTRIGKRPWNSGIRSDGLEV